MKFNYKNFCINHLENYEEVAKNIVDKKYKIIKKLKDTKRNYVALIEIKGKRYVLKYSMNEQNRKFKHFISQFKKGEALETFENVNRIIDLGVSELCIPYAVGVKRKNKKIEESFMLFEYIDGIYFGNYLKITEDEKNLIVKSLKKLHSYGIYHGDANHTNFIKYDNKIRIIDTKCKKSYTGFKKWYDVVTLDDCIKNIYKIYEVNFFNPIFILAFLLKKYKKLRSRIKK
jgi:heptose II phosphotransferase